jgi:hypothetical protein
MDKLFNIGIYKKILVMLLLMTSVCSSAQKNTFKNGRALNFPFRKYGISIGNSHEFNGIRVNFADKNVKRINGLNITLWPDRTYTFRQFIDNDTLDYKSIVNGIDIGVLPIAGSMQPLNIGLLGVITAPDNLNGLSVGGITVVSGGNINGISLSAVCTQARVLNGINLSGLLVGGVSGVNGLAIGGLAVSSDRSDINGIAISPLFLYCGGDCKGIGIGGIFLKSGNFEGLSVGCVNITNQMTGISVGLFNKSKKLRGIQLGILNYAANNPKWLRMLPVINLHTGKN